VLTPFYLSLLKSGVRQINLSRLVQNLTRLIYWIIDQSNNYIFFYAFTYNYAFTKSYIAFIYKKTKYYITINMGYK
jgi:hypothetical protein